ncbi:Transmembrane emp24 domain-containing protein 10, partial [Spiromyces aspiralis]
TSQDNSRIAEVSLKMTSGHSMTDFHKLQVEYKLAPLEVELRRLASNLEDTQEQLTYLKMREAELRSLTELSNDRVKHLNIFAISILITAALGQIMYLRRFFKAKKLI